MKAAAIARKRMTLAELDKSIGAKGAARRLTPGGVRARAQAAGFGRDVLAQIDLLKGKTRAGRKRGLLALIHPQPPGSWSPRPAPTKARAYDVGAPIRVSGGYSGAFAASLGADAAVWVSAAADDDGGESIQAFSVEVFEEETPSSRPATAMSATPRPVSPRVATPPPPPTVEMPMAQALSRGADEDGLLGLDLSLAAGKDGTDDGDQFEREIQAILSGKTRRPAKPAEAQSAPEPAASPVEPASHAHDVFSQMGRNMAYATSFNLPPMELGKRFDEIERDILREESAEARRVQPALSLELTDDDISASLGLAAPPESADLRAATPATTAPVPAAPCPDTGVGPAVPSISAPVVTAAEPAASPAGNGRPLP